MQFQYVPGDQALVKWEDVAELEYMIFIDVDSYDDDDIPQSYRCLGLHGCTSVESDQIIRWGSNVFARSDFLNGVRGEAR